MKSMVIIHYKVLLLICASLELVHGARVVQIFDTVHSICPSWNWTTSQPAYPFETAQFSASPVSTLNSDLHVGQNLYIWRKNSTDQPRSWPEFTFDWRIIIGTLVAFVGATLANSAGVGGGGLFVPMFRLIIGFDTKTSAALSKTMIMGGAIASAFFNLHKKHPEYNRPLIDYDLALLIQPMLLFGISLGVTSNVIFPDWVLTAVLVLILLGMAFKSFSKGICVWKEESEANKAHQLCMQPEAFQESYPVHGTAHQEALYRADTCNLDGQNGVCSVDPYAPCPEYLRALKEHVPQDSVWKLIMWKHIAAISLVWIIYLALQLAKVKTKTCDSLYWLLNVSQLPVSLVATTIGIWRIHCKHQVRPLEEKLLESSVIEPEFKWKLQKLVLYPCLAILAGFVGGFLGIGGGMILAPVFLELGVIPQVTSATTTFVVVFSSSMSVVEFYLLGRLPVTFGVYFSSICALSAIFGLYATQYFVSKYKRTSFIIFMLALIIGSSAIVLGIFGGIQEIEKFMAGDYMGFGSFCIQ